MVLKEYKKLNKYEDYDHAAAAELAEALNEIVTLEARLTFLKELVGENQELHSFVWRTAENKVIALQDIEEDHFKNILQHIVNRGDKIPKAIRAEADRRKVELPVSVRIRLLNGQVMDAEPFGDDIDSLEDVNW